MIRLAKRFKARNNYKLEQLVVVMSVALLAVLATLLLSSSMQSEILNGSGIPRNSVGADGDYYLDRAESVMWGPKADNTWRTRENLAQHPNGESGYGWSNWLGSSWQQAAGEDRRGNGSAIRVTTGQRSGSGVTQAIPEGSLEPGEVFTASIYVKAGNPDDVGKNLWLTFRTRGIDDSQEDIEEAATAFRLLNPNRWQRVSVTSEPASASGSALISLLNTDEGSAGFYLDDLLVERGEVPARYFDGNTYGGVWAGDENASSSSAGQYLGK